jgi:hypothetical protein
LTNAENARGAEEPGVQEVEDRPQVAEPVLHRGSGERESRARSHGFHGARLLGARVLDRLRLVEDRQRPLAALERLGACERAVRRDDEIGAGEVRAPDLGEVARRHRRRVGHARCQRRREAIDLGLPVGKQRRGHDEQMRGIAAPAVLLVKEEQREHLDGLAEPHVVRQAHAEPERRGERQP